MCCLLRRVAPLYWCLRASVRPARPTRRNVGTLLRRLLHLFQRSAIRRFHPLRAEVFADCDFNLGGRGIRNIRGRVVSRLRHPNNMLRLPRWLQVGSLRRPRGTIRD